MSAIIKRRVLDFRVTDYTQREHTIEILDSIPDPWRKNNPDADQRKPDKRNQFMQRWYSSLQGEDSPHNSKPDASKDALLIYRYDWTFGITVLEGHYWDWQKELQEDSSLALHLLLEPKGNNAPEAIPISASLSVLHPSRNTRTMRENFLGALTKTGGKMSAMGSEIVPALKYLSAGFDLGSNLLESSAGKDKNWFLYQFLDENRCCPAVEWRIHRRVLEEFGSLLRGTLYLAFRGGGKSDAGFLRMTFRPQIRYCGVSDIDCIVPTNKLRAAKQVFIDIKTQQPTDQ